MSHILWSNAGFLALAAAAMAWAAWRTRPGPAFPGPRPVGPIFKAWLLIIWGVGLLLPLAALALEGRAPATRWALLPYLAMFVLQVVFELIAWKRLRSPIWVIVPCLFLPWRLFQVWQGMALAPHAPLTALTLDALFVLWVINIGVHYTNIPNTMRWDAHAPDSRFDSLKDPRVFVKDAQ
ncbi:MAG: hypothetical protein ACMVO5_06770 [Polymorphobacter sp.]|uniref:hypothetical protein n=1 Tax=Polymorphobacter sp. TaxID=1909290 RepID=UPI003A8BD174